MTLPREQANSREDLAAYVRALQGEFYSRGSEWENRTLEDFLRALAACIKDHNGGPQARKGATPEPADWGYSAFVLGAATVYE
jgi:hypothetical protein